MQCVLGYIVVGTAELPVSEKCKGEDVSFIIFFKCYFTTITIHRKFLNLSFVGDAYGLMVFVV